MIRDNCLDITKLTTNADILKLFNIVAKHGGVLRFVGGAVRDALKDIKSFDLNLATDLSPDEIFEICTDEGLTTVPLGIRQDAIGINIGGKVIEVSSLHKYVIEKDGTAKIEFTDNWEEDASRRDLTINAVYADENGNIFDYYNGIEDLEKGYVRFIGSASQRIQEDFLRILRYFRFYAHFGLEEPNKKAVEACRENRAGLKKVPMERIRVELFKLILTPNAPRAFRLMQKEGILDYILPDAGYIDDLAFMNQIAGGRHFEDEALVKAFILWRPDIALAENMASRLKFNRREKALFTALAEIDKDLSGYLNRKNRLKLIYQYGTDVVLAGFLSSAAAAQQMPDDLWDIYDTMASVSVPVFPLKGKDLLEQGIEQNQIGKILKELEQIWIESDFILSDRQLLAHIENLQEVI